MANNNIKRALEWDDMFQEADTPAPPEPVYEYEILSHVEFPGTLYVDTGVVPDATTEMYVAFKSLAFTTMFIAGARQAFNSFMFDIADNWFARTEGILFQLGGLSKSNMSVPFGQPTQALLKLSGSQINGTDIGTTFSWPGDKPYSIYLGGLNQAGAIESRMFKGEVSAFTLTKGGEAQVDYQPRRHKASGQFGLFDIKANKFVDVKGTGELIAGTVIGEI